MAAYSVVSDWIRPQLELIQAFIVVFVTCTNEEDTIENEGTRVVISFPHYKYGNFSRRTRAGNSAVCCRIWSNFELIRDYMAVIVTCKNEEDRIKNEGARVVTTFFSL